MKTLTVGSGGREHAMMMEFAAEGIEQISTKPNAGMMRLGENLGVSGTEDIVAAVRQHGDIGLVVVGPEAPLVAGLADGIRNEGIPVLGPGADGARLESSKAFATKFMTKYNIPHPNSFIASTLREAEDYVEGRHVGDYVIKADGLAGGKGVILPKDYREARQTVASMMSGELFGSAGQKIVFQDRLTGAEVSMFALLDGKKATRLFLAQDHKRLLDNDEGPNTGGMGSYSPVTETIISETQTAKLDEILQKTVEGLRQEGIDYRGVLYVGCMLADQFDGDPAVIEYNVRFGDPEAQVVLPLLRDSGMSVHDLFYSAARGNLEGDNNVVKVIEHSGRSALTVCLAAEGYPNAPRTGDPIYSIDRDYEDVTVYHGGTVSREVEGRQIFTSGGRVAYVTGLAETLQIAADRAYAAIGESAIYFKGMQYRTDIGHQVLSQLAK